MISTREQKFEMQQKKLFETSHKYASPGLP